MKHGLLISSIESSSVTLRIRCLDGHGSSFVLSKGIIRSDDQEVSGQKAWFVGI